MTGKRPTDEVVGTDRYSMSNSMREVFIDCEINPDPTFARFFSLHLLVNLHSCARYDGSKSTQLHKVVNGKGVLESKDTR